MEFSFIRLLKQVLRSAPKHTCIVRLHVGYEMFPRIPFLEKKQMIFILGTPAEIATPAAGLHPDESGQ